MTKVQMCFPSTPTCKVIYVNQGVTYFVGLKTPKDEETYRQELLAKKVDIEQVVRIDPVQPIQPIQRNHPAEHQLSRYMSFSD